MDEIIKDKVYKPSYSWTKYKHNFSLLEQDTGDTAKEKKLLIETKKKDQLDKTTFYAKQNKMVRKGMIRYLYLIVDYSKSLLIKDPNLGSKIRHEILSKQLEVFLKQFFDKNPLCKIGLIVTRNEKAERVVGLTGNYFDFLDKFKKHFSYVPSGEPSLENSLKIVNTFMKNIPDYGTKEVLIVYSSVGTVDPGDIFAEIEKTKNLKIKCSVLGFGVKINVLERLVEDTFGKYIVPNGMTDFTTSLQSFSNPFPIENEENRAKQIIPMGFPVQQKGVLTQCYCHKKFKNEGYFCPRCNTKYCTIPVDCKICGLVLSSSFHIARSFHHLFPIKAFEKLELNKDSKQVVHCTGCQNALKKKSSIRVRCPDCLSIFCIECDIFIHESLHVCPTCQ